jgi:hypothetical protein
MAPGGFEVLGKNQYKNSSERIQLVPIDNKVSPLEVLASMGKKAVKRIDDSFFSEIVRGYLSEQALTSFGTSGANFARKYFDLEKTTAPDSFGAVIVGMGQDLVTLGYCIPSYLGGNQSTLVETGAIYGGLKIATQIGAFAMRHYQAEQKELQTEKANRSSRPGEIDAEHFEETGECVSRKPKQGEKK